MTTGRIKPIVESLRRIISKWGKTVTPLITDASVGDTTLDVLSTIRFSAGDEIIIRDPIRGELDLFVDEVIDNQTLTTTKPLESNWTVTQGSVIEKTFNGQWLQSVYVGTPSNIMRYPAVTIEPIGKESKFITLDSTTDKYNFQITVYMEDSNQEDAAFSLYDMTDNIVLGLKRNILPVADPYNVYALDADGNAGDLFLKIPDTSKLSTFGRIHIEDPWDFQTLGIAEIVDSTTIRVNEGLCKDFLVANNASIVFFNRWFYNSWPPNVTYGKVFKGTMLKAATIDWFIEEEILHPFTPGEPNIF